MARPLLIAFLAVFLAAGCNADAETEAERAPPAATTTAEPSTTATDTGRLATGRAPAPVHERCSTRSEAEFGGAFHDPENLVADRSPRRRSRLMTAEVLASFDGQKFPVLVRAGHRVTVRVPDTVSGYLSLGYGPLPQGNVEYADGHPAVTFTACRPGGPSSSSAGRDDPVTFWSGFVFATKPSCAPLDVYVDGETTPRRLEIPLGAAC